MTRGRGRGRGRGRSSPAAAAPAEALQDERFARAVQHDPRFRADASEKKAARVAVDSRFGAVLASSSAFRSTRRVDQYGRRVDPRADAEDLSRFYSRGRGRGRGGFQQQRRHVAAAAAAVPSSDEEESDEDDEEEVAAEEEEEVMEEEEEVLEGDSSKRLAVVGLDWSSLRAVDILSMLSAFVPTGGSIVRVTVYPSKLGQEMLAEEDTNGPPREIFADTKKKDGAEADAESPEEDDDDDEEEEEEEEAEEKAEDEDEFEGMTEAQLEALLAKEERELEEGKFGSEDEEEEAAAEDEEAEEGRAAEEEAADKGNDDDDGFDEEALRKYEELRRKYYFAVVECDSIATAEALYDSCDGVQVGGSACLLDLRFVPDSEEFDEVEQRDSATDVPSTYKPPAQMHNSLEQTRVKLTWDDTPPERQLLARSDFGLSKTGELVEDDFRAYLASDTDDTDSEDEDDAAAEDEGDDEEAKKARLQKRKDRIRKKYEALLSGMDGGRRATAASAATTADDGEETMEVTFVPGLTEVAEGLAQKKKAEKASAAEQAKTPWERYLEHRKEKLATKRREKKEKAATAAEDESGASQDEEEQAKERARLELLMMDERERAAGDDEEDEEEEEEEAASAKPKKKKKTPKYMGKRKRRELEEQEEAEAEGFAVDTQDPRFAGLYTSHEYAPDPTHPEFARTKAMEAIMQERTKRRGEIRERQEHEAQQRSREVRQQQQQHSGTADIALLAASVKRKALQQQQQKKQQQQGTDHPEHKRRRF